MHCQNKMVSVVLAVCRREQRMRCLKHKLSRLCLQAIKKEFADRANALYPGLQIGPHWAGLVAVTASSTFGASAMHLTTRLTPKIVPGVPDSKHYATDDTPSIRLPSNCLNETSVATMLAGLAGTTGLIG